MKNFSKTKSLLTSLVIAIIIVLLAPTALSLFPRVEEIVQPLNVAEKLLANNNGETGYFYLVNQVEGVWKWPWTFGRNNYTRNLNIYCAQEGARASSWSSPLYTGVVWDENSGIWKSDEAYKKISWLKLNFWEVPNASEKAKYTDNEKLAILKTVDDSITLDDVRKVYGSSVEKFKLNQAIVWKYSRNYYDESPNSIITGSTLKVYNALNKLAEKYYNIDRVFNLTAAEEAVWNEQDKTYTWEVSIENTFALPYEKANNGQSTFVLTDNGNILNEGTDYTYDGKVITIKGLENDVHTFNIEVSTHRILTKGKVWLAASAQNLIEMTGSEKKQVVRKAQVTTAKAIEDGKFKLNILKVDENNNPVNDIKFSFNGTEITTGTDGIVKVVDNQTVTKEDEVYEYTISEVKTEKSEKYLKLKEPVTVVLKSGVRTVEGGKTYYSIVNAQFKDEDNNKIIVETENGKTVEISLSVSNENDTTTVVLTIPNNEKIYDLALTKSIIITTEDYLDDYDIDRNGVVDSLDAGVYQALVNPIIQGETITEFLKNNENENVRTAFEEYYQYYTEEELEKMLAANYSEAMNKVVEIMNIYSNASTGRDQDRINAIEAETILNIDGKTTAQYMLDKTVYEVTPDDKIVYKITVYNEGDYNSKNITITDYLPKGLKVVGVTVDTAEVGYNGNDYTWTVDQTNNIATITIEDILEAYNGKELKFADVYIRCEIDKNMLDSGELNYDDILYNVAEITSSEPIDSEGNVVSDVEDRDSDENSITTDTNNNVIDEYTNRFEEVEEQETSISNIDKSKYEYQDDDDFERIVIKDNKRELDLSLRKSITKVGKSESTMENVTSKYNYSEYQKEQNRLPVITEESSLIRLKETNGAYFHPKEAVMVRTGDFVEYTIRVFNEGGNNDYSGIAKQITDYLPEGLEFHAIVNNDGTWITTAQNGIYKTTVDDFYGGYEASYDKENNKVIINYIGSLPLRTKNYLYKIYEFLKNETETYSYYNATQDNREKYVYEEVKIICKVTSTIDSKKLTNVAEITDSVAVEADGTVIPNVTDIDSYKNIDMSETTDVNNSKVNLDTYHDDRNADDVYNQDYIPGCQDDDDFETVVLKFVSGQYTLKIKKVNSISNDSIDGAIFKVNNVETDPTVDGITTVITKEYDETNVNEVDTYTISEVKIDSENKYSKLNEPVTIYVTKALEKTTEDGIENEICKIKNISFEENNVVNTKEVKIEDGTTVEATLTLEDNVIELTIPNKPAGVDLALKKTITHIMKKGENSYKEVKTENGFNVSRFVNNTTENLSISIDKLANKESTNAIYTMNKTPIEVSKGDKVKYSINIYNEGDIAAKARIIKDYIPAGLKLIKVEYGNSELSKFDSSTNSTNANKNFYTYEEGNNYITIYLNEADYIDAFNGNKLDSDSIMVYCEVLDTATGVLTNVAEISCYTTLGDVDYEKDIDSTKDNWIAPNGEDKLTSTKDSEEWRKYSNNQDAYLDGAWHPIESQDAGVDENKGDDDDFDKLIVNNNYNFVIKKVNASNNNSGIDDIKFDITRKTDLGEVSEEKFENVETNNSTIEYAYELPASAEGSITYTIKEIENKEYIQLKEDLKVELTVEKGTVKGYTLSYGDELLLNNIENQIETVTIENDDGIKLNITVEYFDGNVSIIITNKVVNGAKYGLRLRKISSKDDTPLQGVAFEVTKKSYEPNAIRPTEAVVNFNKTNSEGYTNTEINIFDIYNYDVKDEYHIKEIDLGTNKGYTKLNEEITVTVEKILNQNEELVVKQYTVTAGNETKVLDENNLKDTITIEKNGITYNVKIELDNSNNIPTLCVIVPNAPDVDVPLQIKKVDAKDSSTILTGTEYSIYKDGVSTPLFDGIDNSGIVELSDRIKAGNHTLVYKVIEENATEGYDNIFYNKYIQVTVQVTSGVASGVEVKVFDNNGKEDSSLADKVSAQIIDVNGVKTVQLVIKNPETIKILDLALKKTVTHIMKKGENSYTEVKTENGFNVSRFINNTTENLSIDTAKLTTEETTNAIYTMNKTPIEVSKGDLVKYSINIYNEGEIAAKARIVKDYIPAGLKLVKVEYANSELRKYDSATSSSTTNNNFYTYDEGNNYITIYLNEAEYIKEFNGSKLEKDSIIVYCEVLDTAKGVLTNVAEISCYTTVDGVDHDNDIDSTKDNWVALNGENKITSTKDSEDWRKYSNNQDKYLDGAWHPFEAQDKGVDGNKGDDDDFDKLIVNENYNFVIKKVNASNNGNGIDDIKFNITRKTDLGTIEEEKFENVETNNSIIEYTRELPASAKGSITYTIEEIENKAYTQLKKPLIVELVVEKGVVIGYKAFYGNKVLSNNVEKASKTVPCVNDDGIELNITIEYSNGNVSVIIENKVIEDAQYGLKLRKISSGNRNPLAGVGFTVVKKLFTPNSTTAVEENVNVDATNNEGYTNVITNEFNLNNYNVKDEYHITEIDLGANTGYTKLNKEIIVTVEKILNENEKLEVSKFTVKAENETRELNENNLKDTITIGVNGITYIIEFELDNSTEVPTLCVTVPNAPDVNLPLQIKKVDDKDGTTVLTGTEYSIYKDGIDTPLYSGIDNSGLVKLLDRIEAGNHTLVYKVVEENAKEGYDNIFYNKYIKLTVQVTSGVATSVEAKVFNNNGTEDTSLNSKVSAEIIDVENVKTIQLVIKNPETIEVIDLALKKIITEIDGKEVNSTNVLDEKFDRVTQGDDKFRIDTTPLKNGRFNAEYYMNKTPIIVQKGSTIKYQIRIYNEGTEVDATASKITDYIPDGLKFVNVYYQNEATPLVENTDYTFDATNNVLKINVLGNKQLIKKYDNGDKLSYDYITVECKVEDTAKDKLTNVAQISEYKSEDGIVEKDRDSQSNNWRNPNDRNSNNNDTTNKSSNKWQEYNGHISNEYEEGEFKNYLGQQDDDDFEKVIVGEVDLVLKKIITHINENEVSNLDSRYHRFQNGKVEVDTRLFNQNYKVTTADYFLNKTPIKVKVNDTVTYQIRIYNEGSIDATASSITDYIPKGLDLVSVSYDGKTLTKGTEYTYNAETNNLIITAMNGKLINSYPGDRWNHLEPEYDVVTVTCKVNGDVRGLLTNVAEISEYETFYGKTTVDRDSQTTENGEWKAPEGSDKSTLDGKSGSEWARYYSNIVTGEFMNYDGQQDDDDFEKILVTTGYNVKIRKISALDNNIGLENVEIKVNNDTYKTDKNGYIKELGVFEISAGTSLHAYSIEELATDNNYVKLAKPIYLFIRPQENRNGALEIKGYYINFNEPRPEGNAIYNNSGIGSTVYHTKDEKGNLVDIIINISEDEVNVGNYIVNISIENNISDLLYELKLKKQDEKGNTIDGTIFKVLSDNFYNRTKESFKTVNGEAYIGKYTVSESNVNKKDTFTINEIETPEKYYMLNDSIKLIVTKAVKQDKTGYEIANIKLVSGNKESIEGKDIVLEGVELEKNAGTVNVLAKLENNVITITVQNKEKPFDLALRKFISAVNGVELTGADSREPQVDASKLISGESTTAEYNHTKNPVKVKIRDVVEYEIRVYNEGARAGYAELVMDDIPAGLQMIVPGNGENGTSKLNEMYRWKMYRRVQNHEATYEENRLVYDGITYVVTNNPEEAQLIVTDYLSMAYGEKVLEENNIQDGENPNLIGEFDFEEMTEPLYKSLKVEFKVRVNNEPDTIITNEAQVTEDLDEDGNSVEDRDSTPNVWEEPPRDDDQDKEHIFVEKEKEFDFALRKFISAVNGVELKGENSREPQVDTSKLASGESTTAKYDHTKDPVVVSPKDIVLYTLRVFNEGEVAGYAELVMDDIPEGVEMVEPLYDENGKALNLNAKYRWIMYKKASKNEKADIVHDGKYYVRTDKVEDAVLIVTDYLSMENGENMKSDANSENPNLIKEFNSKITKKLDYRDLKVEFKVKPSNKADVVITNKAQITEDSDSEGNSVVDRDSTPNVWEESPRNDDQDVEHIKVKYFDLALYKWVTTTYVTENGKTKEYASEHSQADKSKVVNVTIPKDKLDKTVVKFKYTIKVENQGKLAGYAKEVKDHIPQGLKYVAEDNIEYGWILEPDGTITTDYLKDTLLQPGETAEVEVVLTWINGENNLSEKWNYAEISEDYNEYGAPDIDSTPNNFENEVREDDEDKDMVMLNVRTGSVMIGFVLLGVVVMGIVAAGVVGIKKYVL